ncbi:efflux RND transporter periplasmic adaptor subunit [Bacteriovoracaceae bacterium]|nr:efflux RND transporter periplasmic adaptor subunit [Bacteriovoracaceae bacterium]
MKSLFPILFLIFNLKGCLKESEQASHEIKEKKELYYTCSMHPQIKQKTPGKCPICGMGLTKIELEHDNHADDSVSKEIEQTIYYCESDPSVTSETPGECALDGTPLLKKTTSMQTVANVKLRKSQVRHFRADLFEVTSMKMYKKIRLLGTLLKSEEKESNIPARVPGRVEAVFVQSTGSLIKKGDPVLKLYSPKLLTGGDEFLIAQKNYFKNRDNKEFKDLYEQSIQRMKLWGVQKFQLTRWAKKNKIPREITIYSPVTGIVEKKNAIQGKYFKEGQSFFNLVDLDSLWVEMDVYEHDSALVKIGQSVEIEFSAYQGVNWTGKINFISPVLDSNSRTLKIRTTLENTEGKLRPGMVGTASVSLALEGTPLVVPRTAIIDTGKRKVVWVSQGNHRYQAKSVKAGFESEGYVEIKQGLSKGDQVVIEGNFLLDAQAQLFGGYEEDTNTNEHQH